jgi:hypothetical protein
VTEATIQAYECNLPLSAVYVAVTVETKTLNNYLIRILGGPDSTDLSALSLAGVEDVVCGIPGLMICNPAEPGAPTSDPGFFDEPGRMLIAKRKGAGGGFWKPGDFGLLDTPAGCTGTNCIREYLAQVQPPVPICFSSRVNIRPGVADAVRQGINVRFDKYDGPMSNKTKYRGNANFRPGKDVVKGWTTQGGNACNFEEPSGNEAKGFPRDNVLTAGRFGNGEWDFCGYWEVNHGPCASSPWGAGGNPMRHEVYIWEIQNNQIPDGTISYPTVEDGKTNVAGANNSCYDGPDVCFSPYDPGCSAEEQQSFIDRREIALAVINCEAEGINGNEDNVPVAEWYWMFMTEAVGDAGPGGGPETDIILETIRRVEEGDQILHREIVLYRGFLDVE